MNGPPMNRQMIITGKAKFPTTTPTSGGLGPLAINSAYPATATLASG